MSLGGKLKALRRAQGWTQQEVARRSGVRQSLISQLETGRKTDTTGSVLGRLAQCFHVSIDYLTGRYSDHINPRFWLAAENRLAVMTLLPPMPWA
jgi:transcriptional regulator with XRE-family HTH domain